MLSKNDLKELLVFAEGIVKSAGQILLDEQKVKIVKYKDVKDIVTSADLHSEKFLTDSILKRYPYHGIISEEKGGVNKKSEFRWVIDPLDGTKEFIRRIPLFNVSIALEFKQEIVVSCVYRPSENILYSAALGLGTSRNKDKIRVSPIRSLSEAFVYCYLPSYHRQKDKYEWAWKVLGKVGKKVYRLRSLADENTALCWLAQGGIEAYLNLSNPPNWHDVAPGLLIAKEAGAYFTDASGKKLKSGFVKNLVVANNKSIHSFLLNLIQNKKN